MGFYYRSKLSYEANDFVYFTKSNDHLTTCCNVTIYTIDPFSDPFPRGQWSHGGG